MTIQLLHCEVDEGDESYFRFLVGGSHVKYVTIDPHIFKTEDMTFAPALLPLLPPFPPDHWNEGRISKSPTSEQPFFSQTREADLPAISSLWHSSRVDILPLELLRYSRSNLCVVRNPPSGLSTLAKFARFPWELGYFNAETVAYQWVEGHNIAPRFLGHLIENGRAMGFLLERISSYRHVGPSDLKACQEVLGKLHGLKIKHGDTNRHNFLITPDGKAILIDLECAQQCNDPKALEEEMSNLVVKLADESGRGGGRILVDN